MIKNNFLATLRPAFAVVLFFGCFAVFSAIANGQSTDPDHPTVLSGNTITGSNAGGLSDSKTLYYTFDINKGTLTGTFDLTPTNKSDGGGLLEWTLLTTKFATLKYDNISAQGKPERRMKDMPVTIKRKVILKIVISGNASYKIKFDGSAMGK